MFCPKCGVENENSAKFCKGCGNAIGKNPTSVETKEMVAMPVNAEKIKSAVGKIPKKIIFGAAGVLILLIVLICVVNNVKSTINLNDYVVITAEGYDGYGTASAEIDWGSLEKEKGKELKYKGRVKNTLSLESIASPLGALQLCVDVELDTEKDLSNGDELNYTITVDEEVYQLLDCKLKYKSDTYRVEGLEQIGTFDAFADLEVEFVGIAPNGSANLNYTGDEINYYDFRCDKEDGLKNGDVVKVSIDATNLEYYAERLGKVPATMEKEYTVNGLSSYVTKIEEIPQEALAAMDQQAVDTYKAYVASDWADSSTLLSFNYCGEYLLTSKSNDGWGEQNQLFLVYKAQARNVYETFDKVSDVYWYIRYTDLMLNADGTMDVDITNYYTADNSFAVDSEISNGWWGTQTWTYRGYPSLADLYKAVVTAQLEEYNHEDNVNDVDSSVSAEMTTEESTEEVTAVADSGYILPDSNTKVLKKKHLKDLTAEECKLARNEIYARHGRKFSDATIQAYFDACSWYNGTIEPDDFDESILSDIELKNRDFIVSYEEEMGYR